MTSQIQRFLIPVSLMAIAVAATLSACGGGGSATSLSPPVSGPTGGATSGIASVSSGTLTAFGSVFVNGHEYATTNASVIDDDTGASTTSTAGLEVGMVLDVKADASSTMSNPMASELHVHPLARGIVDASDNTASTLTVMGQTIQLTAATTFSDKRACLTASTSPCTAIAGQSGLSVTTGSGSSATAGNYVSVDGYLYDSGSSAPANIVATLVSIHDAPTASTGPGYKAEGVVTAASGSTVTIGGLNVDLSSAKCYVSGNWSASSCAGVFSTGQVVSAYAAAAPMLPATSLTADAAVLRNKLPIETVGATVEMEGQVSSVSGSTFVIRGINVDASALASTSLPVVGDDVRVSGTVAVGGTSITASAVTVVHAVATASYGFAGAMGGVAAGSAANTYVLTMLGQSIAVNASTRLADLSVRGGGRGDSSTNPFNIATFQTYLAASASRFLQVQTAADANGNLTALSVTIVPTNWFFSSSSTAAGISGVVDATPAPVNSSAAGTPTTFSIHGVPVSADPSAIIRQRFGRIPLAVPAPNGSTTIAAGDYVVVHGSYAGGQLTVAAVSNSGSLSSLGANVVIDSGAPATKGQQGCF